MRDSRVGRSLMARLAEVACLIVLLISVLDLRIRRGKSIGSQAPFLTYPLLRKLEITPGGHLLFYKQEHFLYFDEIALFCCARFLHGPPSYLPFLAYR